MERELLSITDENAILITAEFLAAGKTNKVGERKTRRYQIDLIVNKWITLDQLLAAIQEGIRYQLINYNYDFSNEIVSIIYDDSRETETEMASISDLNNESTQEMMRASGKFDEEEIEQIETTLENQQEYSDSVEQESPIIENDETKETEDNGEYIKRQGYAVCWAVFCVCYNKYLEVSESHSSDPPFGTARVPVIGLGSVDYNCIPLEKDKELKRLYISDIFKCELTKNNGGTRLKDLGFITTSRIVFDPIGWHHSAALIDSIKITKAFKDQVPLYNISERPYRRLDNDTIHIISAGDMPRRNKYNILTTILSPLLMTATMLGVRIFTSGASGGFTWGIMGCMSGVSIVVALVNAKIQKNDHKKNVQEWRENYEKYIQKILNEITRKQTEDIQKLHELYPPARLPFNPDGSQNDLVTKALSISGDIFCKGHDHPEFLQIRIGQSLEGSELVQSVFTIDGDKVESIYSDVKYHNIANKASYPFGIILPGEQSGSPDDKGKRGDLINLSSDIKKVYGYLKLAPVVLDLYKCQALGIVDEQQADYKCLLSNIILNLCFYHSPDDLQIVMFCQETASWFEQQETVKLYRHLPHFRELLGHQSAFAFNKEDAYLIFNKLLKIVSERKEDKTGTKYSHIIVIVQNEYEIKKHPIAEYFPEFNSDEKNTYNGITFIFCKKYMEQLPKYCGQVIERKKDKSETNASWYLLPHEQLITRNSPDGKLVDQKRYIFKPDDFPPIYEDQGNEEDNDRYYRAFKTISSLYYERIAHGAEVPSNIDLIDLISSYSEHFSDGINIGEYLTKYIKANWGYTEDQDEQVTIIPIHDVTKSLAVPLGLKGEKEYIDLDLHEKSDGPHMLVAGTTGSGKTETVLTFLVNLCAMYTPEQVNLLLMDMKGAGFVQRIGQGDNKLPHVVGTVTDISGDETGTGMEYMLKRFLHSMTAEVRRRKLLLNKMDVDSVDAYTTARNNFHKHSLAHEEISENGYTIDDFPPLPHLFLVIDEFTELMRFSSDNSDVDFKSEITSLARIGRSLGFHIILISQNIENAITPDIRVNSRARLCLKVATREASREMIGTDIAYGPLMPGNGRAYLWVGGGSRFEYFQSGYSGADISRNTEPPVIITHAEFTGEYSLFYDSDAMKSDEESNKSAESQDVKKTQLKELVDRIRMIDSSCREKHIWEEPHSIFQQPLPVACFYDFDWQTGKGNYTVLQNNTDNDGK